MAAAAAAGMVAVGSGYSYMNSRRQLLARNWSSEAGFAFPGSCNFPGLAEHSNCMAKVLRDNPGVFVSLVKCIVVVVLVNIVQVTTQIDNKFVSVVTCYV